MAFNVNKLFEAIIIIAIGIALIPVTETLIAGANITDPTASSLIALVPFIFSLGIAISIFRSIMPSGSGGLSGGR